MTTKVAPKKLSQIRAEEKARKQKLRQKRLVEAADKHHKEKKITKANENLYEIVSVKDMLDPVKQIHEKIKTGKAGENDDNMPLEDYFVKEINSLDQTLSEILGAVNNMSNLRRSLKWDETKHLYAEEKSKNFEEKLTKIEGDNEAYRNRLVEVVTKADEDLEQLKRNPNINRDLINAYTINASTTAFAIFAEWNEDVIEQFHDLTDLIDNLKEGEAQ